ncbi:MAG: hypothetical protein EX269_09130 [Acidimicrobiales bacterium]|nr:MAG: hypothetical protein EX269_09130 [Acidimicrobiales bacterium]
MSTEPSGSNEIRADWPELSADVAHRKRLARRVANRAGDHKDQLLATVSSNLADLAGRIAAREIDDERRELESRTRDENLSDRITSETEEWRRSKRTIEDMIGELQRSLDSSDRRAEILEREMLRLRDENTELIEVLEGVFGSLDVLNEDVSSVRGTVDEQHEAMETLVSAADVEAIAAELERRYIELRELVEEARVTAEKASDRADYASDGVSVVQADVEEELEDLKERLRQCALRSGAAVGVRGCCPPGSTRPGKSARSDPRGTRPSPEQSSGAGNCDRPPPASLATVDRPHRQRGQGIAETSASPIASGRC